MDRLVVIISVVFCILLGFIVRLIEYIRIQKRIETTHDYRNKLVDFINELLGHRKFDGTVYIWLTENVNNMQAELGSDGILFMRNPLQGIQTDNYPVLINYLPKLRNFILETERFSSGIMTEEYEREAGHCDDAFIRHIGILNSLKGTICKQLINPIVLFSYGMETLLFLPLSVLTEFRLFSALWVRKLKNSKIAKLMVAIVSLVAFISSVVTIVLGWDEVVKIILRLFDK